MFCKQLSGLGIAVCPGSAKSFISSVLLLAFIMGSSVFAEDAPKNAKKNYAGHPHCGLYCLYSIMKLEGQEIDFSDLIKPKLSLISIIDRRFYAL